MFISIKNLSGFVVIIPVISIASQIDDSYVRVMRDAAPQDFISLFELKPRKISIEISKGNTVVVNGNISNFNVQIESSTELSLLNDFLIQSSIKSDVVDLLLNSFKVGLDSRQCKGSKLTCHINLEKGEYFAVVIDSATDTVRLFFSAEAYGQNSEVVDTVSPYNNNNAIINSPDLYVNYFNGESNMNVNNKTVIGLPLGHLRSNFYSSLLGANKNTEVTEFNYDLEFLKYRIVAGRSQAVDTYNSTSMLTFRTFKKDGIYFLTSRNLNKKDQKNYQKLYFYMSKPGAVEILDDNRIIYNSIVSAGQQSVGYDELPHGNYTVTVRLKEGDRTVSEFRQHIVNTSDFKLNTKEYDFQIGVFRPYVSNVDVPINVDARLAFRPRDSFLFATGISATNTEKMYSAGIKWLQNRDLTLSLGGALLADNANYLTTAISWKGINLSWSQYQAAHRVKNNDGLKSASYSYSSMQDIYFGDQDYQQFMLSGSTSLGNGNIYFSGSYNTNRLEKESTIKSMGYSVGYSTPWLWGSQVGVNITANKSNYFISNGAGSNKNDSWNVGLNFSLPLGNSTSLQISSTRDDQQRTSNEVSLQHAFSINSNLNGSMTAGGATNNNEEYARLNTTLGVRNKVMNANSNISYQSTDTNKINMFGNFNSTQILTRHGMFFSSTPSDSYLVMSDETQKNSYSDLQKKQSAQLSIDSGNKFFSTVDYYAGEKEVIIPLSNYRMYNAKLNTSAFGTYNVNSDQVSGFSLPGSVLNMKTDFKPEYQIIGAFYDSKGSELEQLECFGSSCVSVEKMNPGLFKILLKGSDDFRLNTDGQTCLNYSELGGLTQKLTRISRVDCRAVTSGSGPLMLADKINATPNKKTNDPEIYSQRFMQGEVKSEYESTNETQTDVNITSMRNAKVQEST